MSTRPGVRLLAAACLLGLAACTGGGAEDAAPDEEPTDPTTTECTSSPQEQDGMTAPGEVLCLGTTATVPVVEDGASGVIELAVTGVGQLPQGERAKLDDYPFYSSNFPSSEWDVHLVRYTVKVVSEDTEGAFTGSDTVFDVSWSSVQPWAEEVDSPIGVGPTGCRSADHARGQEPDAEVKGCEWAFVRKGDVHGARFWNTSSGYHPRTGGDYVYWSD